MVVTACGGVSLLQSQPHKNEQHPYETIRAGSFSLNIWRETFVDGKGGGRFELVVHETENAAMATVAVKDAAALRALYLDIAFDPELWRPVEALPTRAMGEDSAVLRLPVLDAAPGRADFGQVLLRPQEQAGLNGDAVLLTLRFERGQADAPVREASALATGPRSRPLVLWEREKDFKLRWSFGGPGDYDQNGETNIADLTALAKVFGESGYFRPFGQYAVTDGDGNGQINLADITVIGQNYGTSVGGYNIYAMNEAALLAWSPGTSPSPGLLIGSVDRNDSQAGSDGTLNYSFDLLADCGKGVPGFSTLPLRLYNDSGTMHLLGFDGMPELDGAYVVVVPADDAEEGSLPAVLGGAEPQFSYQLSPPAAGSGSRLDPFVLSAHTDYQLRLIHATEGNISSSFNVTPLLNYSALPSQSSRIASDWPEGLPQKLDQPHIEYKRFESDAHLFTTHSKAIPLMLVAVEPQLTFSSSV
jgi:hypothetical protein